MATAYPPTDTARAACLLQHLIGLPCTEHQGVDAAQHPKDACQTCDLCVLRSPLSSRFNFLQCATYRGFERAQIVLEHIVDGPAVKGLDGPLLTDGSRDEDNQECPGRAFWLC